jgi:UDP-glucose 4-epimerase
LDDSEVSIQAGDEALWTGRKVLITGGLGFIGSTLAHRLAEAGADILIIDNLAPGQGGNPQNVAGIEDRLRIVIDDLCSMPGLAALIEGRDVIFNLAAQTSHIASMTEPVADIEANCLATIKVLEACRLHNPQATLVYSSTRQVYGRPQRLPVDETHPVRPVDINGVNKLASESYHALYGSNYGLRTVSLRLTNTYGPRMRIKGDRQTLFGSWIRSLLLDEPLPVWGGDQLRDFTFVDDCARALMLAADCPSLRGGVYNLGGPAVILRDLAAMMVVVHGRGAWRIGDFSPEQASIHIGDYQADDHAFRRATGWRPKVDLSDGLRLTLDYFSQHRKIYL